MITTTTLFGLTLMIVFMLFTIVNSGVIKAKNGLNAKENAIVDELVKLNPTNPQDIAQYFQDRKLNGTSVVRIALEVARVLGLIEAKSNLRNIWYEFVKNALQRNGKTLKDPNKILSREAWKLIVYTNTTYTMWGIENSQNPQQITDYYKGWVDENGKPIEICIIQEKKSAFGQLKPFCKMLGFNLVATGGKPSASADNYFFDSLRNKKNISTFDLTDFDEAGYVIYNSHGEHLKYFQSFIEDGKLEYQKVLPFPNHYTDLELQANLYDISTKNASRKYWDSDECVDIRTQYSLPDTKGLEVESLPADPQPIWDRIFPNYTLDSNWNGRARMRLLTLKSVLDKYGIEGFFRYNLENEFNNEEDSNEIVADKSGLNEFYKVKRDIIEILEKVEESFIEDLVEETESTFGELEKWKEEVIDNEIENEDSKHDFTQDVIDSVARDREWLYSSISKPDIPEVIKEDLYIPIEKIAKIAKIKHKIAGLLDELKEIVGDSLEDNDSDEDLDE